MRPKPKPKMERMRETMDRRQQTWGVQQFGFRLHFSGVDQTLQEEEEEEEAPPQEEPEEEEEGQRYRFHRFNLWKETVHARQAPISEESEDSCFFGAKFCSSEAKVESG